MSTLTNPMHSYSLRARTSKLEAKIVSAAASTSDQEISDPNDPIPVPRRHRDVVSGNKSLTSKLRGGHDKASHISEEEDNLQDLQGMTKRSRDQEDPTPDQIFNHWTVDNPNLNLRRSRSLSSLDDVVKTAKPKVVKPADVVPEKDLVAAAENTLTAAQKDKINQRNKVTRTKIARYPSFTSPCEQPSKIRGKGIDPFNWGNVNINEEDLDPEVQQAALDSMNLNPNKKPGKTARDISRLSVSHSDQSARPILQIPLNSYLGQTLKNIHRLGTKKHRTLRSGKDPSSSSSSSSSDSSESENNSDSDREFHSGTSRKRRSRSKGKKRSKRSRKSGLKPIAPKEYDGSADARAYNRFVTEGTTYVIDGRVPRNRRVFVLSYYLNGVAYDFYTQKVSMNFADWTLQELFEELYNYCFPVNYRMEQRLKLKRCFQNDKKVSAYVHELEELYNMIGAADEREKVIKLWYGLQTFIQQGLWRDLLNPETSTWEEVVDHASILEIAHSISEPKDNNDSDAENSATEYDAEYNGVTEYDAEYNSNAEYSTGSDSEYHSDAEYTPNPPGGNQLGNFSGRIRGFQSNQPGSRVLHRSSIGQSQPPRDDGHFGSSQPPSSNIAAFGNRASSRGISNPRFMPKPFEKLKLNIKQEEKNDLMASGKCFACKEVGHIARNCPGESSRRSSSFKPPGVSNFNIGLEVLDEEDSDEVENLYTLRVSAISFRSSGILPEITDGPGASPERVWELSAQEEVPRVACPMGDVNAAKDLEGARFNLADFRDLIYVIDDNRHSGETDYFAFRGPRQRKEGEGEPTLPQNIDFLFPQTFLGSFLSYFVPKNYNAGFNPGLLRFPNFLFILFTQAPIAHSLTTPEAANTLLEPTTVLVPLPRLNTINPGSSVDKDDDHFRTEIHDGHHALSSEAVELENYFLARIATDLTEHDPHANFHLVKNGFLFLLGPLDKPILCVKIPSIMSSVSQGLDPAQIEAIVDATVLQLGDTIQAAVQDAVSALKPPARDTAVMVPAKSAAVLPASAVVPSLAARLSQIAPVVLIFSPMITDDDGTRNFSYKFNFATFNPRAGVPIRIPGDPINIGDFRFDEALVESSERPYILPVRVRSQVRDRQGQDRLDGVVFFQNTRRAYVTKVTFTYYSGLSIPRLHSVVP